MKIVGMLKIVPQGEREIVMSREFDAPRAMVFEAITTPRHVRRWLSGPPGWEMSVCEMDVRVGGRYRWVWRSLKETWDAPAGPSSEMGMGGEYREVSPPARLVQTEQFDQAWYPGIGIGTMELTEHGGRTLLTQTMLYESREARDTVMQSGMEEGVGPSYDRLAELLANQLA